MKATARLSSQSRHNLAGRWLGRTHWYGWIFILGLVLLPVRASIADEVGDEAGARAFVVADANGDSALTLAEFTVFMQHMAEAGETSARLVRAFGVYRIAFRRVDTNSDGIASLSELQAARRGAPGRD